jgi:hypothetical protein
MNGRLLGPKELHPGDVLDNPADRGMAQADGVADVPQRMAVVERFDHLLVPDLLGLFELIPAGFELVLRLDEVLERIVRHALSVNPPFHLWRSDL